MKFCYIIILCIYKVKFVISLEFKVKFFSFLIIILFAQQLLGLCERRLPSLQKALFNMTSRTNTNLTFWDQAHQNKETKWHKSSVHE